MADTSPEVTNPDLDYLDRALTAADIVSLVARSLPEHRPRVRVTKYHKKNKTKLLKLLLDDDEYWTQELYKIAIENEEEGVRARREKNRQHRKQGKAARQSRARQAILEEKFFEVPSEEEVLRCYSEARKATSNASLEHRICAVCARLRHAPEAAFTEMKVTSIPNRHKLVPHTHVPNQTLTHGCLLEPKGCYGNEPDLMANICKECLDELKQPARDTPPKHSLANNLWVGEIPWELECLTFAEQLLIARIYPRVFIMKLYPKDRSGRNLPGDQVNSALRGNVTSFELNGPAIANMVAGQLMPQPVSVLASTLSITFVGRGKLKDPNTLNMLRVRRNAIENALIWLQKNNPKYYGDIKIDKTRLRDLPSDGVPEAILAGIRYETNEAMADEEHQGYVPESYYSDNADTEALPLTEENRDEECDDGDVIPLQHLGVMDNDLTKMPTDELLKWGLRNMEGSVDVSHQEPGYAIRYGAPVNTFGQPPQGYGPGDPNRRNFWEAAFPLLYPYGVGGIESDRPVALSLNAQARWSLEYHDRRFRYHPTFMFTAFGILQRRQGLLSAKLQMRRRDFDALAHTLSTITPEDLRKAAVEEAKGQIVSNPAVRVLKQHVTATARRVMASGPKRTQLRSQVRSAAIYFNQPTIWLTINPDDLHDPIAQIFAGEEIDMDAFIKTAGPDSVRRSQNIARDPVAAAKFFHFTITMMLEKLFGVSVSKTRVHSQKGVLGRVKAYFGTVECQGRGTLHLHMLIWLHNVPPPRRLKEMLQTEEFRARVLTYIAANVRSFRPELRISKEVKEMRAQADIAYSRMPDPALPTEEFSAELEQLEKEVVLAKQIHRCDFAKCLRVDRLKKVSCKRGWPWELSGRDAVNQNGAYLTKRSNPDINTYCPAISHVLKCNQDIKILLHGDETLQLAYYISKYMTKAEGRTHNIASLLSEGLTNHFSEDPNTQDYLRRQEILLSRAVNILNREQELSAPLVALHILGLPDVFRSHHSENIYWGTFMSYVERTFEGLNNESSMEEPTQSDNMNRELSANAVLPEEPTAEGQGIEVHTEDNPSVLQSIAEEPSECRENNGTENVTLNFDGFGKIYKRSQVDDYIYRGDHTASYNVLNYFVDTYEQVASDKRLDSVAFQDPGQLLDHGEDDDCTEGEDGAGRPAHARVEYQIVHPRATTHVRVIRPPNHNHMPNFIGLRFPRSSDPAQANIYAACVLLLLKPWRCPNDIKRPEQSWGDALNEFLGTADDRTLDIIDNLEHSNKAQVAAEDKDQCFELENDVVMEGNLMDVDPRDEELPFVDQRCLNDRNITQEMIDKAQSELENYREHVHGVLAVRIAQRKGIFNSLQMPVRTCDERASLMDAQMLKTWKTLLKQKTTENDVCDDPTNMRIISSNIIGTVEPLPVDGTSLGSTSVNKQLPGVYAEPSNPIPYHELLPDQRRAFEIFRWHLEQTRRAREHHQVPKPPQLRLLMTGEGGTGKSRVIQTITREFKRLGLESWLVKAAFTGCAASHIEGRTTHSIAKISVGKKNKPLSDESKKEMTRMWQPVEYLIIDEYSMLSKEFLAQLSRRIGTAKLGDGSGDGDLSFGGINVILCGDAHQIPPVASKKGGALYHPATSLEFRTLTDAGLGRKVYEGFNAVVILKQQVRVTDPQWQRFLSNFRVGQVLESDIAVLDSVTLTHPDCRPTDFTSATWQGCVLITPRNSTQIQWNNMSVEDHCRRTGEQMLVVNALDTCKDQDKRRPITMWERWVSLKNAASLRRKKYSDRSKERNTSLAQQVRIAIGMKVMITMNLNTDVDVTNGARGVIVGIKLNADEPMFNPTDPQVTLTMMPACVLVKLDRTRAGKLPGLEAGVIPIVPASKEYAIVLPVTQDDGKTILVRRWVKRLQLPITPAYAFTDYRAQGQTLSSAIIDIAEPPTGGGLDQANVYVALSRCSGLENVRILRDFDRAILKKPIDMDLVKEDERLEQLNASTTAWWNRMNV